MGKIVALSGALHGTEELNGIFARIVKMTGKRHPEMVFLPTAHRDVFDPDWAGQFTEFLRLGCRLRLLFVTQESREDVTRALENADIIYACGGNLKFLMEAWRSSGACEAIREAYRRGAVLAGNSSGAMCWFREGWDDCGENGAYEFVDCLGLLPYCNCPHFESSGWQKFRGVIGTRGISGIAVEDDAAVICENGVLSCVQATGVGRVHYFDAQNGFAETDITDRVWKPGENPAK
jgi:dipeptidase E